MSCKAFFFLACVFVSISGFKCWLPIQDDYCFVQDDQKYSFYNKYTPYDFVYNTQKLGALSDGCVPIHFIMISRSGHHFPSLQTIQNINEVIAVIKNNLQQNGNSIQLCPEDINLLTSYLSNIDENMAKKLTPQGNRDIIEMAKRKKQEFPTIFDHPYSPNLFKFVVDDSVDSKESASAFALGLFNSADIVIEETDAELLKQIRKVCLDFQRSEEVMERYNHFFNSDIVAKSVLNINRRLGFYNNEGLTKEQIIILFKACGFDASRDLTKKSIFCVPFTPYDLQVFDYLEDLSRYYTRYVLNEKKREELASPLIQDIFHTLNKIVSQDGTNQGESISDFYFPYRGVKNSFMAAIGLIDVNDAIMSSENYENCDNRPFKTSQIDPYSSNIDLILYRCEIGEKYRVMIRLQEKPLPQLIEGGDGSGLYGWSLFSNYIQNLFGKTSGGQTTTPQYTTLDLDQVIVPRKKIVLHF